MLILKPLSVEDIMLQIVPGLAFISDACLPQKPGKAAQ